MLTLPGSEDMKLPAGRAPKCSSCEDSLLHSQQCLSSCEIGLARRSVLMDLSLQVPPILCDPSGPQHILPHRLAGPPDRLESL